MVIINVQVFSVPLEIVIRNPTHRVPSCDTSPLLMFSAIGEDQVSSDADAVRVFIDGEEVSVTRVGEAYGYDYYGADDILGTADDGYGYDGIPGEWEEWGWDGYGADDIYGTPDDHYGADEIPGTADDGYGADGTYGTSLRRSRFGYGSDDTYGSDGLPGTMHIFELPEMTEGHHTIRLVIKSKSGLITEQTETFIVDASAPVITIISPANDPLTPLSEVPTLEYTLEDYTGILKVNVNIDGTDYGWIPSGTLLDFLKSGVHTITITAHDRAINECFEGNINMASTQFNLLRPIEFGALPRLFYIGTDATTKTKSADAIFEELRVLNQMSTDADVLNEFKILRERIRFQLREGDVVLSADEVLVLQQVGASSDRINLPDQTLMLCHYDSNVESEAGVGELENPSSQIIDELVAGRRVDVTVNYYEGTYIDKELIEQLIRRVMPAFVEVSVTFEAVQR